MLTGRRQALLIFLAVTLQAGPAWAVQAHGGAEGLVSHQIGHILFTLGMGYLLYRLRSLPQHGGGWLEFKIFTWLLIAWNIMTFAGHGMHEFVPPAKLIQGHAMSLSLTIDTLHDALYYLTRLDHLILVPAFVFLLLALRKWRMAQ